MTYVLQHIFGCLFVAALIGGIVGWLLRHFAAASRIGDLTAEWGRKLELADAERERLSGKVKESEASVGSWRTKFANLETEHGQMRTTLDATASKLPGLEAALAGWVAKSAVWDKSKVQLEADLKTCGEARSTLQVQVGDLNTKIAAAEAAAKNWQGKFASLETAHAQLKTAADATAAKIPGLESTIAGWAAKAEAWDKTKGGLETDLKAATAARAAWQADVDDMKGKVAATEQRVAVAEAGVKDWRGRFAALDSSHAQLKAAAEKSDTDLKAATAARAALEGQINDWRTRFTALETSHAQLKAAAEKSDTDLKAATGARSALETRFTALESSHTQLKGASEKNDGELKAATAARAALESQINDWRTRFTALETSHAQLKAAAEKSDAELKAQLKGASEKNDGEIKAAATARAALEGQINDWRTRFIALETSHAQLKATSEKSDTDLKAAAAARTALDSQINDWRTRFTALETSHAQLKAAAEKTDADLKAATGARTALETRFTELQTLHTQVKATSDQTRSELEARITEMTRQLSALDAERAKLKADMRKAADDDLIEDARYQKEIASLKAAADRVPALETAIAGWVAKSALWDQSRASYDTDIKVAADARASLEAQVRELRAERSAAQPIAMAAAAGAGSTAASPSPDQGLRQRFDAFIVRTQKDGYGDIERIEGIGPVYGQKLRGIGIAWVKDLLAEGAAPAGRQEIADQTGIDRRLILKWVNAADLLRLNGVTPDWAELLEAAGVDTVKELRNRNAGNLVGKLEETNAASHLAREVPTLDQVTGWIEQAKKLDPKVTH